MSKGWRQVTSKHTPSHDVLKSAHCGSRRSSGPLHSSKRTTTTLREFKERAARLHVALVGGLTGDTLTKDGDLLFAPPPRLEDPLPGPGQHSRGGRHAGSTSGRGRSSQAPPRPGNKVGRIDGCPGPAVAVIVGAPALASAASGRAGGRGPEWFDAVREWSPVGLAGVDAERGARWPQRALRRQRVRARRSRGVATRPCAGRGGAEVEGAAHGAHPGVRQRNARASRPSTCHLPEAW